MIGVDEIARNYDYPIEYINSKKFVMNKSSVRRALTTLKRSGLIKASAVDFRNALVELSVHVPVELTHPKKRTLKTKKVPKTIQTN